MVKQQSPRTLQTETSHSLSLISQTVCFIRKFEELAKSLTRRRVFNLRKSIRLMGMLIALYPFVKAHSFRDSQRRSNAIYKVKQELDAETLKFCCLQNENRFLNEQIAQVYNENSNLKSELWQKSTSCENSKRQLAALQAALQEQQQKADKAISKLNEKSPSCKQLKISCKKLKISCEELESQLASSERTVIKLKNQLEDAEWGPVQCWSYIVGESTSVDSHATVASM